MGDVAVEPPVRETGARNGTGVAARSFSPFRCARPGRKKIGTAARASSIRGPSTSHMRLDAFLPQVLGHKKQFFS